MTTTHSAADAQEGALRRAWMVAWAQARAELVDEPRVTEAIRFRSTVLVMGALPWQQVFARLLTRLVPPVKRVVEASGKANAPEIPTVKKADPATVTFRFNAAHPGVSATANRLTLDMLEGVTEESKQAIRELLGKLFTGGTETVESIARQLRQHLGLTRAQSAALLRKQTELFRMAADPGEAMTVERAQALADDYAQRLQAQRAETIARTEAMRAANGGQQELWRQAQEQGLLPPEQKRRWLITPDERLCPVCAPIPDNGPVGLHESFVTGEGTLVFAPPVHPNCRCTTALVIDFGD